MTHNGARFLPLFCAVIQTLPAQTSTPDLAAQVIANEIRLDQRIDSFTFEFESTARRYSPAGKLLSETVTSGETYMSPVTNVDVALELDGKAVKLKEVEKQRKQAVIRLQTDAKRPPYDYDNDIGVGGFSSGNVHMSVINVLRYCTLSQHGTEDGFVVVAFDQCESRFRQHAHFPHIRGTIRINSPTRTMDSWKALIKDGPSAGSVFYQQTTQLGPGGMRVPASFHINLAAAPHLFPTDHSEFNYRWTHPQRFGVEADQTVQAPPH